MEIDFKNHAIAGLSMGGLESLTIGINQAGYFAYVGGFSSALQNAKFDKLMLDPGNARDLRQLWIACGTSDHLIDPNRDFISGPAPKNSPSHPSKPPANTPGSSGATTSSTSRLCSSGIRSDGDAGSVIEQSPDLDRRNIQ